MKQHDIPAKASRILYLFSVTLILFFGRIIILSTSDHDKYASFAKSSQERVLGKKAMRGTIYDRFGIPLATNKIEYNIAICYADLGHIPRISYEHKHKVYKRREYIENLSIFLAELLEMEPQAVEDIIYSRASLFPNTPFVVKEGLSESLYYSLRMLEREWPGLRAQIGHKRDYPKKDLAGDILGYMGAISDREYLSLANEIRELKAFLADWDEGLPIPLPKGYDSLSAVRSRYNALKERSYTINDHVGKGGVEKAFEEELRGFAGKTRLEVGMQGKFLRELPNSKKPIAGSSIYLTISSELQKYAEQLLEKSENERGQRFHLAGVRHDEIAPPQIKGGAIVAMIPQTGEIVAMASYPRHNPNELRAGSTEIHKWLESETYIAEFWNGKRPLSLEEFLSSTLSLKGSVRRAINSVKTVASAINLQRSALIMQELGSAPTMRALFTDIPKLDDELFLAAKKQLDSYLGKIENVDDKLLFLDLLRLVADEAYFSSEILEEYGNLSLSAYRLLTQKKIREREREKEEAKKAFHNNQFAAWRKNHFSHYLKEKRSEEKEKGRYEKPYLDYLNDKEQELFREYSEKEPKEPHFRAHHELTKPLYGRYPNVRNVKGKQYQKHLASAFYPLGGFGFSRSASYRQAACLGSIFKVVTGYEALLQTEAKGKSDLNPLTIIDNGAPSGPLGPTTILGHMMDGRPIYRRHNGGHLPRSHAQIGKADFRHAMERSSNIYFSLLCTEVMKEPTDLLHAAHSFGFGQKTGIELPYEYAGHLPTDLRENRSNLYAFAIGQHSLTVTPLQTASMLATLANYGKRLCPHIVHKKTENALSKSPFKAPDYPCKSYLNSIGINFPLFTETSYRTSDLLEEVTEPQEQTSITLSKRVRSYLLKSLDGVVWGEHGAASPYRIRSLYSTPGWHRDYVNLKHQLIGKTSTAERSYRPTLDREMQPILVKDIWFGGISFTPSSSEWDEPELAVVVYLRYGDYGKEAAPIASQIVKKWREIINQK